MSGSRRTLALSAACLAFAAGGAAGAAADRAPADEATSAPGEATIVMKAVSAPGESGEIVVFVGEQVHYAPKDIGCGAGCVMFDSWHVARYRVAQWIHGVPPGSEVEFTVAEHAVAKPFGHSRYALVFVERFEDTWSLVKYQQVPVYPTADGAFASCGPMNDPGPGSALRHGDPPLEDIDFAPRLVVDETRRLSAHGRREAHDPRWHAAVGDEVLCTRGVPLPALVPAMVRGDDTLAAALPELSEAR